MFVEIDGNTAELYGEIFFGEGPWLIQELKSLFSNIEGDVRIHIHTPGGSVMDANLLYNYLAKNSERIHMVIDGIAASMGSLLILASKKVSIVDNGFVMTHAPWGTVQGSKKEMLTAANLLEDMEQSFIQRYIDKTGKSKKEVSKWLEGDNWFSAQKALEIGMVDEVISANEKFEVEGINKLPLQSLFGHFKNTIQPPSTPSVPTPKCKQKTNIKMKQALIAAFGLEGLTAESSDSAFIQAMQNQLEDAKASSQSKDEEIAKLKASIENFGKLAVTDFVDAQVASGKITEDKREKYEQMGASIGLDNLKSVFEDMSGRPAPLSGSISKNPALADKSWDDLSKESGALEKLREEDPESYASLYKEKFGKDLPK